MMATASITIDVCSGAVTLFAEKAAYFHLYSTLVVADLHIGKADHFRKHGIAAPDNQDIDALLRLSALIDIVSPDKVVFLGDLFHSRVNAAWDVFGQWLHRIGNVSPILVKGNHDILGDEAFKDSGLELADDLQMGTFLFTHDRVETTLYNIHGHLHPAVGMRGAGRSYMRLPCFLFSESYAVLPAFGNFTGKAVLKPQRKDRVFVTSGREIAEVSALNV